VVEIGQQFVTPPFDNLQGGKGSGLGQGVKGALNLHLTHMSKKKIVMWFLWPIVLPEF
jgi:hypothetical protein